MNSLVASISKPKFQSADLQFSPSQKNTRSHALTKVISFSNFNFLPTGLSHLFVTEKGTCSSMYLGSEAAANSSKYP